MFQTPILFIVFNRLDTVKKVFEEIKNQKPKYLYVACDGYRKQIPSEEEKCQQVKDYVVNNINWDCELKTNFLTENKGPSKGVAYFISWFFENVEQGIILEHDCLPHPDFFPYCEELLNYYKNNESISMISGNNFLVKEKINDYSYYLSKHPYIWGWATWARTWKNYDVDRRFTNKAITELLNRNFTSSHLKRHWKFRNHLLNKGFVNTWDLQLCFTVWLQNTYCITPSVNLVSNIGFGKEAVHCTDKNNQAAFLPIFSILPLKHLKELAYHDFADVKYYKKFQYKSLVRYIVCLFIYYLRDLFNKIKTIKSLI